MQSQRLPKGDPGSARARVAELHELLARAKAARDERERQHLEINSRLEATLAAERTERLAIEEERTSAAARVEHLEHTLAQAIRRLALIDEKLAATAASAGPEDTGDAEAPPAT